MQNGGETAEQLVRMALTSGEVTVRLGASAIKNVAAFLLALRQSGRMVFGRSSLGKLLAHSRELRTFPMTARQFKDFSRRARGYKILFAGVKAKGGKDAPVDLILPMSEIERANIVFEKVGYLAEEKAAEQEKPAAKKGSPSRQGSKDTRDRSTTRADAAGKTSKEKPSVEGKLVAYEKQAKARAAKRKTRVRVRAGSPKR